MYDSSGAICGQVSVTGVLIAEPMLTGFLYSPLTNFE
jgi:hypothetical protein